MHGSSLKHSWVGLVVPRRTCLAGVQESWLQHPNLARRLAGAVTLGQIVMFAAWALSYLLLPEGLLRGRTAAGIATAATDEVMSTLAQALVC